MIKSPRKENLLNLLNLIPIIMAILQSLLKGVRIQIINMVFIAVFIWFIETQFRNQWRWHIQLKQIFKISIIAIVIGVGFYQSKEIVGRLQDDMGVVKYVTTYLGGPIELLNLFLKNGVSNRGETIETLSGFCSSLQKIGLFEGKTITTVGEYRDTITGVSVGNVYGAIRAYYHDFGVLGVIICFFLLSIFLNIMYCKVYKKGNGNIKNPSLLILFSTFVYGIFFLTFADFITGKFSFGGMIELIYIWLFTQILLKPYHRIKIRIR